MKNDTNIFDLNILNSLFETLGKEKLAELLEGYIGRADELVELLSSGHVDQIFEKAHEMKGMAANYGFAEVSAQAKVLEDVVQAEQDVTEAVKKLSDAHRRAKIAIAEWLDNKGD